MKNLGTKMKKKLHLLLTVVLLSVSFSFVSCDDDDDDDAIAPVTMNIVEIAQQTASLSTLTTAIVAAGLDGALSGDTPYTVFAPTNAAFEKLDPTTLNTIISTPSLLTNLLQYHVVSGTVTSGDLSNGPVPTLLSGQTINIDIASGVVLNGSSNVTVADIAATNGVIHIIDEVLLPEDFVAQTIVQIAASNPDFSTLVSILLMDEMADILAAANDITQDLTVFAPTNQAFTDLLAALGKDDLSQLPITLVKEIIQYHLLGMSVMSSELSDGQTEETLLVGESITVDLSNGVMINNANVIAADVNAVNGVIHGIDAVLVPSYAAQTVGSIAEVIMFDPNYTILVEALKTAELLEVISTSTDDLTLFAPDNAAFIAAGITSLDGQTKESLTPILLYHVVAGRVLSTDLPNVDMAMAETLSGDNLYFGLLTSSVLINGLTTITAVDMEKNNGVVHTINRTLVPPAIDVVDIAVAFSQMSEDAEFTVLVSLLTNPTYADITQKLRDANDVTVFAPTDAAFAAIETVLPTLTETQVRSVLEYHAAGARVFSSDLVDQQVLPMINMETVKVNISSTGVTLTDKSGGADANVIEVNVHGSNGVIHVIDKVLLPTL
jgi:transforming growth factor-beta-induced protein